MPRCKVVPETLRSEQMNRLSLPEVGCSGCSYNYLEGEKRRRSQIGTAMVPDKCFSGDGYVSFL